jgi:hypothetical protein
MTHPATRHARPPARRIGWRAAGGIALAAAAAAAATATLIAVSSPARPALSLAQQKHQQGVNAGLALDTGRGTGRPVTIPAIRLGLTGTAADATALTGLNLGYYKQALGGHAQLDPVTYPTPAAEATALQAGKLQAAYLTPAAAIQAWTNSGHSLRIVAGAAASHERPVTVLVMTRQFLTTHPGQVLQILQADIRASQLLITSPATARPAVQAEIATLTRTRPAARQLDKNLARLNYTPDPMTSQLLAAARRSSGSHNIAVGQLLDVSPVDQILRTSGLPPIGT